MIGLYWHFVDVVRLQFLVNLAAVVALALLGLLLGLSTGDVATRHANAAPWSAPRP